MMVPVSHVCEYYSHTDVKQAHREITSVTSATDRFVEAYRECGFTQETLAKALGYSSSGSIGNAVARGSLPKKMPEFEQLTGIRASWVKDGTGPKYVSSQAQSVSLSSVENRLAELPQLEWRETMDKIEAGDLPQRFRVKMPDNAMAPKAREGWWVAFERADLGEAGKRVLVRTRTGSVYCRRYTEPDSSGRWIAKPDNGDFQQFDSVEHGLTVVARMLYVETPDED